MTLETVNTTSDRPFLKEPPHSIEAEQAVLGGLMLDPKAWAVIDGKLCPDDFYKKAHGLIFQAIQALAEAGQDIDQITISERLESMGKDNETGGLAYVGELVMHTPTAANIGAYANIVKQRAKHREFLSLSTLLNRRAIEIDSAQIDQEIDQLLNKLTSWQAAQDGWGQPEDLTPTLSPVYPLTKEMIPMPLRAWVLDIAHRMQCPPDFVAIPAIVAAGAVIGTGCGIYPKKRDDWLVLPNLWGAIIGRPSMLKTPSMTEAIKPLARLEAEAKAEYEAMLKAHEADLEYAKATRDALKKEMQQAAQNKGKRCFEQIKADFADLDEPEPPTPKRYKTNDATVEKLTELLRDNDHGVMLYRDELVGFLASLEKEGRESDRAFFLEAWNGYGSYTADRIGRGTVHTDNLCLSLLGGIQPDKLTAYLNQMINGLQNDGLYQRLQLMIYPDEPKNWRNIDQYPDKEARARVNALFDRLAEGYLYPAPTDDQRYPVLRFSPKGQQVFNDWLESLQKKLANADDNPLVTEHLAKYRSLMPSLALIFHLLELAEVGVKDENEPAAVSEAAAHLAWLWCDYLESHARRVYALSTKSNDQQAAYLLSRKIGAGQLPDGFTARDIIRKSWAGLTERETIDHALRELVASNWIKPINVETSQRGGRPAVRYRINPMIKLKSKPN